MKHEQAAAIAREIRLSVGLEWERGAGLHRQITDAILSAYRKGAEEMRERCAQLALGYIGKRPETGSASDTVVSLPEATGFQFATLLRRLPLDEDPEQQGDSDGR